MTQATRKNDDRTGGSKDRSPIVNQTVTCRDCMDERRCYICSGTGIRDYGEGPEDCARCDGTGLCWCADD